MKVTATVLGLWAAAAFASDPTDSLMDADSMQSGYLPNHNMDPSIISGGSFGQLWKYTGPVSVTGFVEQFHAKPLVYTPSSLGRQVVITVSELNRIYVNDAVNGTLITMRDLGAEGEGPFLVADLGGCNDISNSIGITGTPVIDPNTDTMYFWAKAYMANGLRGYQNGAYRFHAVDTATLVERPGYPINLNGHPADNDNTRWFIGGINLQRPSLNLVNGAVYAGFGGHCDQYNYTGWVVGVSTYPSNPQILAAYVTSGGPGAPAPGPPGDTSFTGGGGACGIWMSGDGLASDNAGRLFFATGNGQKVTDNSNLPSSGRTHLDTLSESMVNLAIDPATGALSQADYFEPAQYQAMDAGDRDLGSGGLALLDPGTFSGGGISRVAVTCGKNGQCFITNADNLGGFKMSSTGGDAVIQTLSTPSGNAFFNNIGSYPLEGGYIYLTPVGSPTYVYQLGFDSSGRPSFTLAAQTVETASGGVGIGSATITTLKGQPGTALLWIVDPNSGIRCYNAVPQNGQMIKLNVPPVGGVSKFQRLAFGNGKYYTTSNGAILGFGAPVATPLHCSSPAVFGSLPLGSTETLLINCTANVALTLQGLTIGGSLYQASNSSLPQSALVAGQSFSFPVTFNLTTFVPTANSTSAPAVQPGVQNTALFLYTVNAVKGFSTLQPIALQGSAVSSKPFLTISPLQVNFPGIVLGTGSASTGTAATFVIHNIGSTTMTILGYAFTTGSGISGPFTNVTFPGNGSTVLDSNGKFTSSDLPSLGTTVSASSSITVDVNYLSSTIGSDFTILEVWSDGGSAYTVMTGNTNTAPIALLEASNNGGNYTVIANCAIPANGCTYQINIGNTTGLETIRFTNNGGSVLTVTKSKPPVGSILGATNPTTDLSEGLNILPGNTSSATVFFSPPRSPLNSPTIVYSGTWTLNTNDLTFGIHVLNFTGFQVSQQVGPLLNISQPQFQYLGCYLDSQGNRIEGTSVNNVNNTNGLCQTQALASNLPFAGTEFTTECWMGYNIPPASAKVSNSLCSGFLCPGDSTQGCGGPGGYLNLFYDTTKYNATSGQFINGVAPPSDPPIIGGYTFAGCFNDSTAARALIGTTRAASTIALESCASFCAGFNFFGTEFASQCYCSNAISNSPVLQPLSSCNMPCTGNKSELCGAAGRISLYAFNGTSLNTTAPVQTLTASSTTASTPTATPLVPGPLVIGNYTYQECLTDNTTIRSLQGHTLAAADMTLEHCAGNCTGFKYWGCEYSKECYCGNTITFGAVAATDGRCKMLCGGNSSEICGGASGLTLYQLTSTLPQANVSSSSSITVSSSTVSSSTISSSSVSSSNSATSTVSSSSSSSSSAISSSSSASSTSTEPSSSSSATSASSTSSSASSSSSSASISSSSASSTSSISSTSASSTSTESSSSSSLSSTTTISSSSSSSLSSSSSTSSSASAASAGPTWVPLGCYNDTTANRALNAVTLTNTTGMTVGFCQSFCTGKNYPLAGVEFGIQCFCDLAFRHNSTGGQTGCTKACAGNAAELCGGSSRLNVYNATDYVYPVDVASANGYTRQGCFTDSTTTRGLSSFSFASSTTMTVESCTAGCLAKGFVKAGLEFGSQCYCGNTIAATSLATALSDCEVSFCAGNNKEFCGAASRLLVYSSV